MKGRLNGRHIRISTNPSPFNQSEVNFRKTMFYDELNPADEYHVSRTIGTLVLEEEEGSNTHDLGSGTLGSL